MWFAQSALAVALASLGCVTSSRVYLLPAEKDRIHATAPLVELFEPTHGYFWADGDQLFVTLARHDNTQKGSLLWRTFDLSLALDGLPASVARSYEVTPRTLRAIIHEGATHRRFASVFGIVAILVDKKSPDRITGRFRLWANQQEFAAWQDAWTYDRPVMFVGDFSAVRDPGRGGRILQATEVEEMRRPPKVAGPVPVTGPTTRPTKTR